MTNSVYVVLCLWSEYQNPCYSPRALAFTSPTDHSLPACSTLCAHHTNGKYALSVECTEVGKATKRKTKAKVRTIAACLLLCWLCRWFVGGVNDTSSTLHTIPLIAIRKRPSAVNVKTGALRSYTLSFKLPFAVVWRWYDIVCVYVTSNEQSENILINRMKCKTQFLSALEKLVNCLQRSLVCVCALFGTFSGIVRKHAEWWRWISK